MCTKVRQQLVHRWLLYVKYPCVDDVASVFNVTNSEGKSCSSSFIHLYVCVCFSPGSVVTNYNLQLHEDKSVTLTQVSEAFNNATQDGSMLGGFELDATSSTFEGRSETYGAVAGINILRKYESSSAVTANTLGWSHRVGY